MFSQMGMHQIILSLQWVNFKTLIKELNKQQKKSSYKYNGPKGSLELENIMKNQDKVFLSSH